MQAVSWEKLGNREGEHNTGWGCTSQIEDVALSAHARVIASAADSAAGAGAQAEHRRDRQRTDGQTEERVPAPDAVLIGMYDHKMIADVEGWAQWNRRCWIAGTSGHWTGSFLSQAPVPGR